jgi:4a-hydroxytetrahydrobiopterin dehydratase
VSKLESNEVEKLFSDLPLEWSLIGGTQLEKACSFPDFKTALDHVDRVGRLAEDMNHHPDIHLGYGKVDIVITTHSEGGLTKKDFDLAQAIEKIPV